MRALTLTNGHITVNLDEFGQLRDFYYPFVGLENHVLGHTHRLGVWVNNNFWWLANNPAWECQCHFAHSTMVGETIFQNKDIGITLTFIDAVDIHKNIFIRRIVINNHTDHDKEVKLFFCQEFLIGEHRLANTAFYDPEIKALIHYKGRRVFLINGADEFKRYGLHDFTVGVWGYNGTNGSFLDAEDGHLSQNPVDHGPTDSVASLKVTLKSNQTKSLYFFIAVGESIEDVKKLNRRVLKHDPANLIESAHDYWKAWVNKHHRDYGNLSQEEIALFERSLLVVRSHFDNHGGVVASSDSDRLSYGKEGYGFVWPRDGAFAVIALDNAGYCEVTKPFFHFMADVITEDGYLRHKYLPDKSLGSTWHSSVGQKAWLTKNGLQLPIQEDETASVVFALWNHYEHTLDIEMIEKLYEKLITPAAWFMVKYRDRITGLPKESYDLWEEKLGVATYTVASVYAGLIACSKFAKLLGNHTEFETFRDTASDIRRSMLKYCFSETRNSFIRTVFFTDNGDLQYEEIIDASTLFSLWYFQILDCNDPKFIATYNAVQTQLKNTCPTGGFIRYEGDEYYRHSDKSNPWFITTLWDIQFDIFKAKNQTDLENTIKKLSWIIAHQTKSGILAEQLDAYSGKPLCVSPLTWSHSAYVDTIMMYLNKKKDLENNLSL